MQIKLEGMMFSDKGGEYKFLLLKRILEDGGFWQPLTGTLEVGEGFDECLYRELEEETGIKKSIGVTEEVWRFEWKKGDDTITEFVFGIRLEGNEMIRLNPEEHSSYRWCTFGEAIELLEKDNNKNAFEEFKKKFFTETPSLF